MLTARICDPIAQQPFASFVHNTTTYVSIPHGHPSVLFLQADECKPEQPIRASIQVGGREVYSHQMNCQPSFIELSKLPAPPHIGSFGDLFIPLMRKRPAPEPMRLYSFSIVFQSCDADARTLATYQFHVLCPPEFEQAEEFHLRLQRDPKAIAPDSITDRCEGNCCPDCRAVRLSMK